MGNITPLTSMAIRYGQYVCNTKPSVFWGPGFYYQKMYILLHLLPYILARNSAGEVVAASLGIGGPHSVIALGVKYVVILNIKQTLTTCR